MKYLAVILLIASTTFSAHANYTKEQLDEFKDSIKQGCIDRGKVRKDENAVSFCNCMDNILRTNLTDNHFEEMATLALTGKDPFQVPSLKALMPQIAMCKKDVGA